MTERLADGSVKSASWNDPYLKVGVPLFVLVAALAVTSLLRATEVWTAVTAVALALVLVIASVLVSQRISENIVSDRLLSITRENFEAAQSCHADAQATLRKALLLITDPKFEWLKSNEQLAGIEGETSEGHIWVVSPDLQNITLGGAFRRVVMHNLEKGITYTYFVPGTHLIRGRIARLKHAFPGHKERLVFRTIPEDKFNRLALTHILMLNPHELNEEPCKVFFEAPVEGRGYWIEADSSLATKMLGRLKYYLDHHEESSWA